MIFDASQFVFEAPKAISRARRVLIKPNATYGAPYPVSTSPQMITTIIEGIRKASDADIILLEGTPNNSPVEPLFRKLGYNFPRILTLDVKDSIWVEVENPLAKPLMVPTFWVPNVILSSDYLISVTPMKIVNKQPHFTLMNLLSLLPVSKYKGDAPSGWRTLYELGIDKVIADLYFTLPFDLGVVDARQIFMSTDNPVQGKTEEYGKIIAGEPYEVDREAAQVSGNSSGYLAMIESGKSELEA